MFKVKIECGNSVNENQMQNVWSIISDTKTYSSTVKVAEDIYKVATFSFNKKYYLERVASPAYQVRYFVRNKSKQLVGSVVFEELPRKKSFLSSIIHGIGFIRENFK